MRTKPKTKVFKEAGQDIEEFIGYLNDQREQIQKLQNEGVDFHMDLDIMYKGKKDSSLNMGLVLKQKLTQEDIEEIKRLHVIRLDLFDYMRKPEVVKDREILRHCVNGMEYIEYAMQKAWKFEKDRNKHTWWYKVPNCECPQLDNEELFGIDMRIINVECPCHGKF